MGITIIEKETLLSIKKEWTDILRKCPHTIFSTWEWLSTCWKHFGKGKKLTVLLAEENDEIIGIAPLMYSVHKMFGLRRGKIEFIGTQISDYNDFIIVEKHAECLEAFTNYLYKIPEKWECIDLLDIPENAKCLPFLAKISKSLKPVHKCALISLPSSYDDFLMRFNKKRRWKLKRAMRRLEEDFVVEFVDYSVPELCEEGMQILFDLHQKRWQSRGFSGVFADQVSRNFNMDIAKTFAQKGWLGLYGLKLSGENAAISYGFNYNLKHYGYLSGFDPKYSYHGVGNMLMLYMIRKFIQEGFTEIDFLRGAEEYKDQWNTIGRFNYQAFITKRGTIANVKHWFYRAYWRQANRLKHLLKT
ncbi:MAG: GNAT family N-acetyltransferase [Candidatus Bathyarchaeia archaeon]